MMKPDLRDVHIYGGMILIAIGVLAYVGWPGAVVAVGACVMYLGIYRMGRL
tara:strand:- start:5715 stop:5867 length:153 start_codon:yes stop_codon:yes gene_type:complete